VAGEPDRRTHRPSEDSGLAQGLEEIDRKLLSRELDGFDPFLDPREPINDGFAELLCSEWGNSICPMPYGTKISSMTLRLPAQAGPHSNIHFL
jgi:hypothetical protein